MKKKSTEFLELLKNFLGVYLPCSVGASVNTINSYKYAFQLLLVYMYERKKIPADKVTFLDLEYETLIDFFSWLETERDCCAATRNQRLSALSSFANYAQNRSFDAATVFRSDVTKLPSKRCQHKLRSVFTLEEIGILLGLPKHSNETEIRDQTLLSVMYASGARAQEICDIKVGDIRFNKDAASITLHGKGGKIRRLGIPIGCAALLKQYILRREIGNQAEMHLFSSQTHEHMTVSCIEGIFRKYVNLAKANHHDLFKEKSYPPHSMRHSTATHMLEAGVPIVVIKNFLGHSSLQSTQIYAEVTQNTLDKHIKAWNDKWMFKPEIAVNIKDSNSLIPDFLKK